MSVPVCLLIFIISKLLVFFISSLFFCLLVITYLPTYVHEPIITIVYHVCMYTYKLCMVEGEGGSACMYSKLSYIDYIVIY